MAVAQLNRIALDYEVVQPLHCVALRCVALRCVALRCVALRCVAVELHCVAVELQCIALLPLNYNALRCR